MTSSLRRTLAGCALLLGTTLLVRTVMPMVRTGIAAHWHEAQESIGHLEEARRLLSVGAILADSLRTTLGQFLAAAPRLIEGRTQAEASAALHHLVRSRAEASGLAVRRQEPVADSARGTFQRVQTSADLEGDVRALARFLLAIEGGTVLLTIPTLAVTSAEPGERPGMPEVLRIQLDVRGLYIPREAP
jgi:hypothetical protein